MEKVPTKKQASLAIDIVNAVKDGKIIQFKFNNNR